MIRVAVYSGPSKTDPRPPAVTVRETPEREVPEVLREIGLEWKQADYMTQRQVVITLDPIQSTPDVSAAVTFMQRAIERLGGEE